MEGGARESSEEWEKHKGEKSDLIESLCQERPKARNPISLRKLVVRPSPTASSGAHNIMV